MVAGIILLAANRLRPAKGALLLLLPIGFLAVMFSFRLEPMTIFLTVSMTLFLMAIFTATYLGGGWLWYSLPDYIVRFSDLFLSFFSRGVVFIRQTVRAQPEKKKASRVKRFGPALRGALIALPILAILTALLASADLVFSQRLGDTARAFKLENLPEYLLRGFIIAAVAYFLAGILLHAATKSRDEEHVLGDKPVSQFLGFTESVIIMGSVVVLFASFVAIQFQYFFGGEKNIDLDGYTYAEYARRGFSELMAVAIFSLLMLILMSLFSRRETRKRRLIFSGMGVGLVVLVLVILTSAFQRILLYEEAYGFSRLRTYTHVFLIWLGLLLVAIMLLEILQRHRIYALAAVLTSLGFVITLGVINVDGLIVNQNVNRAIDGSELDTGYLKSLSDDAVPALANSYRLTAIQTSLHDDLGKVLVSFKLQRENSEGEPWQSYNFSRSRADSALNELDSELEAYGTGE